MRSAVRVGFVMAAFFALAAPALALFTPHSSKNLTSVEAAESTFSGGGATVGCASAKATGGEINATGTESDIGIISWSKCVASVGKSELAATVSCNHPVFDQPSKEGTKTGKFTLTLKEDCTLTVGGVCVITVPSETEKKIEKGTQERVAEGEKSEFVNEKTTMTVSGAGCSVAGIEGTKGGKIKLPSVLQLGVGLE
jgi:hypothetical protein